jgi:hypothetical protein
VNKITVLLQGKKFPVSVHEKRFADPNQKESEAFFDGSESELKSF